MPGERFLRGSAEVGKSLVVPFATHQSPRIWVQCMSPYTYRDSHHFQGPSGWQPRGTRMATKKLLVNLLGFYLRARQKLTRTIEGNPIWGDQTTHLIHIYYGKFKGFPLNSALFGFGNGNIRTPCFSWKTFEGRLGICYFLVVFDGFDFYGMKISHLSEHHLGRYMFGSLFQYPTVIISGVWVGWR